MISRCNAVMIFILQVILISQKIHIYSFSKLLTTYVCQRSKFSNTDNTPFIQKCLPLSCSYSLLLNYCSQISAANPCQQKIKSTIGIPNKFTHNDMLCVQQLYRKDTKGQSIVYTKFIPYTCQVT